MSWESAKPWMTLVPLLIRAAAMRSRWAWALLGGGVTARCSGGGAKDDIYCMINDMVSQGKSVVMIAAELPELLGMGDRIYVMNEGRLLAEVNAAEATQENIMGYIIRDAARA